MINLVSSLRMIPAFVTALTGMLVPGNKPSQAQEAPGAKDQVTVQALSSKSYGPGRNGELASNGAYLAKAEDRRITVTELRNSTVTNINTDGYVMDYSVSPNGTVVVREENFRYPSSGSGIAEGRLLIFSASEILGSEIITDSNSAQSLSSYPAYRQFVQIFDPKGKQIGEITDVVYRTALSPDGTRIVSGNGAGVQVRSLAGVELYGNNNIGGVTSVQFLPDGKTVFAATERGEAYLMNDQGKVTKLQTTGTEAIYGAEVSPDGSKAAYQTTTGLHIVFMNANQPETLYGQDKPDGLVEWQHPKFSPDGKFLADYAHEVLVIRNLQTGNESTCPTGATASPIRFSNDSQLVGLSTRDGLVVLRASSGVPVQVDQPVDLVNGVFGKDSYLPAVNFEDGNWRLVDLDFKVHTFHITNSPK